MCFLTTGPNYRGQLLPFSRQTSSNASEGGGNRESSLDDSGVVDDHEEQDVELVNISTAEVNIFLFFYSNTNTLDII